jgi:hypothetical protein
VTTPGIDPGIVRLAAQRLNHYATPGPVIEKINETKFKVISKWLKITEKIRK